MKKLMLLLLLASCCRQQGWVYREVITDCQEFNSAFLSHPPENAFSGIELQFLRGEFGTLGYLSVHSRQIPSFRGHCNAAVVVVVIDGEQYPSEGVLMEGGQKVLLSVETTELIIEALLACKPVIIYLEGFTSEICPDHFSAKYQQFCKVPA